MKESIAQSFIVSLILFFFGILVLLYFGSINYSKAYKAKNRIITILEKYGEFNDDKVRSEIETNLSNGGYQTTTSNVLEKCKKFVPTSTTGSTGNLVYPTDADKNRIYDYCVIEYESGLGKYYQVVTFMKFEVPVVGNMLEFAVKGETKVLYENING